MVDPNLLIGLSMLTTGLVLGAIFALCNFSALYFLVVQEWPIASASSFSVIPLGGWFFLLLGFGLAVARHHIGTRDFPRRAPCPTL